MSGPKHNPERFGVERDVLAQIATAIEAIRFGSVEVIIQDGKVIQIERKEKIRFNPGNRKDRGQTLPE